MTIDTPNKAAAIAAHVRHYDESTRASWFWALLFGPIYYAVHGFWGRAAIVLVLNFFVVGFFIAPFLAYPAWKDRARTRAVQDAAISAALR